MTNYMALIFVCTRSYLAMVGDAVTEYEHAVDRNS